MLKARGSGQHIEIAMMVIGGTEDIRVGIKVNKGDNDPSRDIEFPYVYTDPTLPRKIIRHIQDVLKRSGY